MAEVFIAYSRQDTRFVRQLFDAFIANDYELWVDWQGIGYSSEWWEEICAGIERADNFVFIISPNSLNSKSCHQEIEHARKHKKRIIPFIYQPIDEVLILETWATHPELRTMEALCRANWKALKGIQFMLDEVAGKMPNAKTARPEQFVDLSLLQQLEKEGFFAEMAKRYP